MRRVEDNLLISFPSPDGLRGREVTPGDVERALQSVRADNSKWMLLISYGPEVVRVYLFRKGPTPG